MTREPTTQSYNTMRRQLMLVLLLLISVSTATMVKTSPPPLEQQEQHEQPQHKEEEEKADFSASFSIATTATNTATTEAEKCRWGEHCSSSPSSSSNNNNNNHSNHDSSIQQDQNQQQNSQQPQQHQIPFVKSKHQYVPPEGFMVTARVYTNTTTKLAHFDTVTNPVGHNNNNNNNKHMMIPFINCASTGITTAPLKLQYAYFRHTVWSRPHDVFENANGGAILLVTLADSIVLELNSGEKQEFGPGSVILLQDNGDGGHKCYSSPPGKDVTVLFMALPKSFRWQLPAAVASSSSSLSQTNHHHTDSVNSNNPMDSMSTTDAAAAAAANRKKRQQEEQFYYCLQQQPPNRALRVALTGMGISITLLLADWWGKVAPIWLSVGIGGGCLVVGGTIGFVKLSESLLEQWYVYREQQQQQQSSLLWMTQRTTTNPTTSTTSSSSTTTTLENDNNALQDDNGTAKNNKLS